MEGSGKVQGRFREGAGEIQGRFRKGSGKAQGRSRVDSGNIQVMIRKGSRKLPESFLNFLNLSTEHKNFAVLVKGHLGSENYFINEMLQSTKN